MPRPISASNFPSTAEAKRGESPMRKALPMGAFKDHPFCLGGVQDNPNLPSAWLF
jgi:hypothetical protein